MSAAAPAAIGAAVPGGRDATSTISRTEAPAWRFRLMLMALGVALILSIIVAASVGAVAVPLPSVAGILLHRAGAWWRPLSWSATEDRKSTRLNSSH